VCLIVGAAVAAAVSSVAAGSHERSAELRASAQTVYVSPQGHDSSCRRGTPGLPCSSLARAYAISRPGDTLLLAGGTYKGDQHLPFESSSSSPPVVTITPAKGQRVIFDGSLNFDGSSHITVDGAGRLRVDSMNAAIVNGHRPSYLTVTGVRAFTAHGATSPEPFGASNYFDSVDHLTLRNIEIGPACCDLDGLDIAIGNPGDPNPTNVVLDHVYIHDIELSCSDLPAQYRSQCHVPPTDEHVDCVQFFGGVNVVVENSRFFDCSESNLMTGSGNGGTFANWTIQNNLFGSLVNPDNGVDISDGGPGDSPWGGTIRVLHNTFEGGPSGPALIFGEGPGVFRPGTKAYLAGNAGGLSRLCLPNTVNLSVTFEWNVWGPYKCGPRDVRGRIALVRETVEDPDLHLSRSSQGIASVDPKVGPAVDAEGVLRPRYWNADAGALQREPAGIALGASVGRVALGMKRDAVVASEGSPTGTHPNAQLVADTYRRFGGTLDVEYANGIVVAVGTTSRYYSTPAGLAVGQALPTVTAGWNTCLTGVRRNAHGRVAISIGRHGRVASIWNVARQYADRVCGARP
jgi:hypothetical protein